MNIVICAAQVPFVRGGAENHVDGLRDALRRHGHRTEIVALPFKWYPTPEILKSALAWRLLDLSEANGVPIDLVICTKFPTWAVKHRRKIAWVIHQHRQAYEWYGTQLSDFSGSEEDSEIRRRVVELDRRGLRECVALYANSANVAGRLQRSIGLQATPLHVPINLEGLEPESFDDYILSVSRLDPTKRVNVLLEAMALTAGTFRAVIVGAGAEARSLRSLARELGIGERVEFRGRVDDRDLVRLYNHARAVYYSPLDEDFGLVTVEAFSAGKPVLTANDSGGVLELVENDVSGVIVDQPSPPLMAAGLERLMSDDGLAKRLGAAGRARVTNIRWDRVVEQLTSHA